MLGLVLFLAGIASQTGRAAADNRSEIRQVYGLGDPDNPYSVLRLGVIANELVRADRGTTALDMELVAGGNSRVFVHPGEQVHYEVRGLLSDDANEGLALIGMTLVFDGGDLEQADSPIGEPTPGCENPMINFEKPWGLTNPAGFGGTIIGGDLVQAGGAQNTIRNTPENNEFPIGPVLLGVAQPSVCGRAVLLTGSLDAPLESGTYTLDAMDVFANVIKEGETGADGAFFATEAAGIRFVHPLTIVVVKPRFRDRVDRW